MNIIFEDEYGETIVVVTGDAVPRIGEMIIYGDEDYRVKNVTWYITDYKVIVTITQNLVKKQKEDDLSGRLSELKNVIVGHGKRLDSQEKKGRNLTEQLRSIRNQSYTQKGNVNDSK